MANETNYIPCKYKGNGTTLNFPFSWGYFDDSEIIVNIENSSGVQTTLTLGTDYDVTPDSTGGEVICKVAPTSEEYIIISRDTSNLQKTRYSTSVGFQGTEIEKSFDKVSCCLQDIVYSSKRAIKIPIGSTALDLSLPQPNAGKTLKWNEDNTGLINSDVNIDDIDDAVQTAKNYSEQAQNSATNASNSANKANAASERLADLLGQLPDPTDNEGKILKTDGVTVSWADERRTDLRNYIKSCATDADGKPNLLQNVGEGTLNLSKSIKLGTDTSNTSYINTSGFFAISGDGENTQNYNQTYTLNEQITNVQSVTIGLKQYAAHRANSNIYAYAVFSDGETLIGSLVGGGDTNQTKTFTIQVENRTLIAIRITAYSNAWSNGYTDRNASTTSNIVVNYLQATSSGIQLNISADNPLIYVASNGKVITSTITQAVDFSSGYTNNLYYLFYNNNNNINTTLNYTKSTKAPTSPVTGDMWLDMSKDPNQLKKYSGTAWEDYEGVLIGNATKKDNAILSFNQPAVGISNVLSGASMPSSRYINLTLGASGTKYTAPANGWYSVAMMSSATNQYLSIDKNKLSSTGWSSASGCVVRLFLPVLKGDIVRLFYSMPKNQTEHDYLYFIYAESSA